MRYDIFVCHSSKDKVIADAVVSALENNGLRCWVAPRDIKPGTDWGDAIVEAIDGCKILLLIFSAKSNRSRHVLDEITDAITTEKIILPFRIENLDPTGAMSLHLFSRHWLDAYQPSWQAHINQLINSAADSLGRTPAAPGGQEESLTLVIEPVSKERKKVPYLWIGLTVVITAILIVARFQWFGSRDGGEDTQPAVISAPVTNDAATSNDAVMLTPTTTTTTSQTETETQIQTETETQTQTEKTIIVTSVKDSGAGTLRYALLDARAGDTIIFDSVIFPPTNPVAIMIKTLLPPIWRGNLTLDASNAGVILDGSQAGSEGPEGIVIDSDYNVIKGLQVLHFAGPGIKLNANARFNVIGGDRSIGLGPLGEGNLLSGNADGIGIWGSDNVITGNLIGTDITGSGDMGNIVAGIFLEEDASRHTIGPDNIIAYND